MFAVDDGIWTGNVNFADVMFLIAAILFVVYALIGFATTVDARLHTVLLGLGLACVSVALLVL